MPFLHRIAGRLPSPLPAPLTDQKPAARQIRNSAKHYRKLPALNVSTSLAASLDEGVTLGIILLFVSRTSAPENRDCSRISFLGFLNQLPWLQNCLNSALSSRTGRDGIFTLLLATAVALQVLLAAAGHVNGLSTAMIGARGGTEITAKRNERILSLTHGCASRYRVGDLLNHLGSGASTVQKEISLANGLLMNGLQLIIDLAILLALSPWLLLVGLYEPAGGHILIDGVELRAIDLASWHQRLGAVSQDTFLFNASNSGFDVEDVLMDDVVEADTKAQVARFMEDLPEGFDTRIGAPGSRLSGGQRQRISLTRAILQGPELLILDEATRGLDSQSERLVQQTIEQFELHHTMLMIAHRLSTIIDADMNFVLSESRIVERGRHHELLTQGGIYAKLWSDQSKHPLEKPVTTAMA